MNTYRICRPCYRPAEPGYFRLHFETVSLIKAYSAEHALRLAKKAGYFCPIIEHSKESMQ